MDSEQEKMDEDNALQDALAACQDKLFALIRMLMVRDSQNAPDVLQRTNEIILTHAEQHDPSKPFLPWFKSVAVSQVQMHFRSKKRSHLEYDSELVDTLAEEVQEKKLFRGAELDEYLDALKACMGKVPAVKRDLLQKRYFEGKGVDDLAAEFSVSASSLAKLFFRLRQSLRTCIEKTLHFRQKKDELGAGEPDFSATLDRFLDDRMNDADGTAFVQELAHSPQKREEYMEQAFLHAFMLCRKRNLFSPQEGMSRKPVFRVFVRCAAALLALLAGVFLLWNAAGRRQESLALAPGKARAAAGKISAPAAPRAEMPQTVAKAVVAPAVLPLPVVTNAVAAAPAPSLPKQNTKKEEAMKYAETAWKEVIKKSVAAAAILASTNAIVAPVAQAADDTTGYVTWSGPATNSELYGFYSGKYWSDGLAPHSGTNYLVADPRSEHHMRTPDAWSGTYTFAGDSLTVGVLGGNQGWILQKSVGSSKTYFNHLYLNKGWYLSGSPSTAFIYGPVTVSASADEPFGFMGASNEHDTRALWFYGDMDGTGHLAVARMTAGEDVLGTREVRFLGNNRGFTGKFVVQGTNFFLRLPKNEAMGDEPAEMMADAITLRNHGGFGAVTDVILKPVNRGITVESTGGALISDSGTTILDLPIAGSGPVYKTGSRWLELRNTYSAGDLSVIQNILILTNVTLVGSQKITVCTNCALDVSTEVLAGHPLEVLGGGILYAGAIGGIGELTVSNGIFRAGSGQEVDYNFRSGACDMLNIRGEQTSFTPPFRVKPVGSVVYTNCTERFAFLTLPESIQTVTASDFFFDPASALDPYGLATYSFEVEKDAEGMQTVYLVYSSKSVYLTKSMPWGNNWSTAGYWSDGKGASAGKDYFVSGLSMRTLDNMSAPLQTFPGDSLTLTDGAWIDLKCSIASFPDLRLYNGGGPSTSSSGSFTLYGSIGIYGTSSAPAMFNSFASRPLVIAASLHGSGFLRCKNPLAKTVGSVTITESNTNFYGGIYVTGFTPDSTETLVISDEKNLGSNPSNYLDNALVLTSNGVLQTTQSLTLDDANRGLTIGIGTGSVQIAAGDTLTLNLSGTLNASGTFQAFGGGTLAMGGALDGAGAAVFTNCTLRPTIAAILPRAQLQFQNGSSLVLSQPAADATLAQYGLLCTNAAAVTVSGTVKVVVTPGNGKQETTFTLPVFTLPKGQVLPTSSINATTTLPLFKAPKWVTKDVVVGGVPCTTWSLYFKSNKGTVVMLM